MRNMRRPVRLDLVRRMGQRGVWGVGKEHIFSEEGAPGGLGQGRGTCGTRASCSRARAEVGATRIETHISPYTSVLEYKHGDTDNISVADKSLTEVEVHSAFLLYVRCCSL